MRKMRNEEKTEKTVSRKRKGDSLDWAYEQVQEE